MIALEKIALEKIALEVDSFCRLLLTTMPNARSTKELSSWACQCVLCDAKLNKLTETLLDAANVNNNIHETHLCHQCS